MTQQTEQQEVEQLSEEQNKKNYQTLIAWYRAPRPGVAPCGYEFNNTDPSAMGLIRCVDPNARDLSFDLLNKAAQSSEFLKGKYAFHVAPHPDNYQAIIADFMQNNVPSTIKTKNGKGVYANIAAEMGVYIKAHFNNEFSKQTLKSALLAVRPETAEEYAIEKEKRLQQRDTEQRGQDSVKNARIAHGHEVAPELEQNDYTARQQIAGILQKLIEGGFREFAAAESERIKSYLKEGATTLGALEILKSHASEFTALKAIDRLVKGSVGKTSGQIWTNRKHLETVLAECNKRHFPAEKIAHILLNETNFLEGSRGVTNDPRGRKVEYDVEWGK